MLLNAFIMYTIGGMYCNMYTIGGMYSYIVQHCMRVLLRGQNMRTALPACIVRMAMRVQRSFTAGVEPEKSHLHIANNIRNALSLAHIQ